MNTRTFLIGFSLLFASMAPPPVGAQPESEPTDPAEVVVYHDPSCGCCGKWMEHLREVGFDVRSETTSDMRTIKQKLGVPASLPSCHTAVADGYVIEGHVPAADVERLLAERPDVAGIAVPGMPIGSPGMEYGAQRQAFDVLTFDRAGQTRVFNRYEAQPK